MSEPARVSEFTKASARDRQVAEMAHQLMLDYMRIYGDPPPRSWLLRELGLEPPRSCAGG